MKKRHIKGNMVLIEIICAILFCVFAFFFLFFFQSDVLGYAQHVLSKGTTTYSPFVGMFIVLVLCVLLKLLVRRLYPVYHLLTPASSWFPSALLMAFFTDCHIKTSTELSYGTMWWLGMLLLLAYVILVWLFSRMFPFAVGAPAKGAEWKALGANVGLLMAILFTSALISNTDINEHVALRMEHLIAEQRYSDLEQMDKKIALNDSNLVKYRAYALECQNALGERFFEYTHEGNGSQLFPTTELMLKNEQLYNKLGVRPAENIDEYHALEWLREQGRLKESGKNYLLTAYLMDASLDDFAQLLIENNDSIPTSSTSLSSYPKHFREALVIYKHVCQNPVVTISDNALETDFDDFCQIVRSTQAGKPRQTALRKNYYNTYWYYFYCRK